MNFDAVFAVNEILGMGNGNGLPWGKPISKDMEEFKRKTLGKIVVMGRKTFFSLPEKYRPLPNRINVVLTKTPEKFEDFANDNVVFLDSVSSVIDFCREYSNGVNPVVIGGPMTLDMFWNRIDRVQLTYVHDKSEADVFFPKRMFDELVDSNVWHCVGRRFYPSDNEPTIDVLRFVRPHISSINL